VSWNRQSVTGPISGTINFVFDSIVGFPGMEDRLDLFPVALNHVTKLPYRHACFIWSPSLQ